MGEKAGTRKRHHVAVSSRQCAMFAVIVLFMSACDWSGFGFDAANTRSTADAAPSVDAVRELAHAWSGPTAGPVASNPIVADNTALVTTTAGTLEAFGPVGGPDTPRCQFQTVCRPRWTATLGGPSTSTPTVSQGVVYAASDAGTLETFDLAGQSGCGGNPVVCTRRWSTVPVGALTSSPLVFGTTVYVGSADGNLYAYDAAGTTNCSGGVCAPLWRGPTGGAVTSSPAGSGSTVYVGSASGSLVAFDAGGTTNCTGRVCAPLWTASADGAVQSSPTISEGRVYIGSNSGTVSAFDAAGSVGCAGNPRTCSPRWTASTTGPIVASPAVGDGVLFIGSDDGTLRAYDAAGERECSGVPSHCEPIWVAALGGAVRGSPALANKVVYAGTSTGTLAAFDSAGTQGCGGSPVVCTPLWSRTVPGATSPPAVSRGRIFVGSETGLHVFLLVVPELPAELTTHTLTADSSDVFSFTADAPDTAVARAGSENVSGNTRVVFTRTDDLGSIDDQTCGTWESDAGGINQEGAALRVHPVDGGVKAITVTKNIAFGATWIFNVHVWDTSRLPVATQIASFDLGTTFRPGQVVRPLPWRLCARTDGSVVSFIVWPSSHPQPEWNDPAHGGSVVLPSGYAGAGTFGWYVGHLLATDEAAFGDLGIGASLSASGTRASTSSPRSPTNIASLP